MIALLETRVGFPDVWRDYRGLEIERGRSVRQPHARPQFDNARRMARMARPEERGEWMITGAADA